MFSTILTWTASNTSEMLSYVVGTITDLTPLMIPIIAIGLGLIIFSVIVAVIRNR